MSDRERLATPSRRSVLGASGLALAAGTAGCLGQLGGSGGSAEPVNDELTLWHAMGGGNGEIGRAHV